MDAPNSQLSFFDTHCHIHGADYPLDAEQTWQSAMAKRVERILCVGTDSVTSRDAVAFAASHAQTWASIGLHPHDATLTDTAFKDLQILAETAPANTLVAVGECGLDYYYAHSEKKDQIKALRAQIELAISHNLPLIFHVRDAFKDFWPIFDDYHSQGVTLRGVVHSFTDTQENLELLLERNLYVGVNGIMTFTKSAEQLAMAKSIPLKHLVLETDAPFLTPKPHRGTINKPEMVVEIASFLAGLREETLESIAQATTNNARKLFNV